MTTDEPIKVTRSARELVDNHVPYSEMSEEEINAVIAYHAEIKSKNAILDAQIEEHNKTQKMLADLAEAEHNEALEAFNSIIGDVTARALAVEEVLKQYE